MAGVWIVSDNRGHALELLNIGRQLAAKMGTCVSLLLYQERKEIEDYINYGADDVMLLPSLSGEQLPESYVPVISEEAKKEDPDLIIFAATPRGKNIAALIAEELDAGLVSSCMAIDFDYVHKTLLMDRLAYGGAAVQKLTCSARPAMVTIPPRTYEPAAGRRPKRTRPGTPYTSTFRS